MSETRLTFLPIQTPTTDDTRRQVRARPRKHAALTTLYPRSPYARQHDAIRDALLLPRSCATLYCLPLLPHHCCATLPLTALLRTATACCVHADDVKLLLPRCCYLAILASNTPTKAKQSKQPSRIPYLKSLGVKITEVD